MMMIIIIYDVHHHTLNSICNTYNHTTFVTTKGSKSTKKNFFSSIMVKLFASACLPFDYFYFYIYFCFFFLCIHLLLLLLSFAFGRLWFFTCSNNNDERVLGGKISILLSFLILLFFKIWIWICCCCWFFYACVHVESIFFFFANVQIYYIIYIYKYRFLNDL